MKNNQLALFLFLILSSSVIKAQSVDDRISGTITYITSQNVYVRFNSTELIKPGDTLYFNQAGKFSPCLMVTQKSSTSCISERINDCELNVGESVTHLLPKPLVEEPEKKEVKIDSTTPVQIEVIKPIEDSVKSKKAPRKKEKIRGSASAATYSNLSSNNENSRHRAVLRFSLQANRINDSRFSFETYLNYTQNFIAAEMPQGYITKFFRVHNFALRYDVDSTLSLTLGRKINRKVSSIGAIDGLQTEKYFGKFYGGAIIGFRPNLFDYGLNLNLLEYGAYGGYYTTGKSFYSETTLGLLEQRNKGITDRRYTYLQHTSSISGRLNLFSSVELDLFRNVNGNTDAKPRLTNLYVSAQYKVNDRLSLLMSFDSRKNIIYYESKSSEVEDLLANDMARQGVRLRINYKPFKNFTVGASYSLRFQNDNSNKSSNLNGFVSYTNLPRLGGSIFLNYNLNESNYLESNIISVKYYRGLVKNKLDGYIYYRLLSYSYPRWEIKGSNRQYVGANLSLGISKTLMLSLLGEISTVESKADYRINTRLIKRF